MGSQHRQKIIKKERKNLIHFNPQRKEKSLRRKNQTHHQIHYHYRLRNCNLQGRILGTHEITKRSQYGQHLENLPKN